MRPSAAVAVMLCKLLTGATARWVAAPPQGQQRVYFANHTSHLDFLAVWSALPRRARSRTRPVAAADYWTASRLKRYLAAHVFGAVLVARAGHRSASSLKAMLAALEQGDSLILFPQGTRSQSEEIGEFRAGLYFLAKNYPAAELVPTYLQNLNRVLPKGELFPVPVIASVTFGLPLSFAPEEPKEDFLRRAESALKELQEG